MIDVTLARNSCLCFTAWNEKKTKFFKTWKTPKTNELIPETLRLYIIRAEQTISEFTIFLVHFKPKLNVILTFILVIFLHGSLIHLQQKTDVNGWGQHSYKPN